MTLRAAVATGLLIVAAAAVSFRAVYEPDLWWHLAHGRENLAGHIVRTNVFSFTYPDYCQHFTSWLFDTAAFAAWRIGGGTGIQVLQFIFIAATLVFVYRSARIRAPASAAFAVAVLAFFVIEPRAIPRPHLMSFAALAARACRDDGESYGVGIFRHIYENLSVPRILDIAELRPPRWPTYRAFFVYLGVAVVLFAFSQERRRYGKRLQRSCLLRLACATYA